MTGGEPEPTAAFRALRDALLEHRGDLAAAHAAYAWPELPSFNWALDWFDRIAAGNTRTALRVVDGTSTRECCFRDLAGRADQVANFLSGTGVQRGDRVLVLLPNDIPLWEVLLACMKLGAVVVPTYVTVSATELADRITRAGIRHAIVHHDLISQVGDAVAPLNRICVGPARPGWHGFADSHRAARDFVPDGATAPGDPLLCYFTSGTTARPKLVVHSHTSYPVGHLSGMYWNGLRPGDVHLNMAQPGWAKHAWSSFFAPWSAEATVVAIGVPDPPAALVLRVLAEQAVTSFCAPPTVWRQLLTEDLRAYPVRLREAVSAGEPLDAAVVDRIAEYWGVRVRNGYGQTETTAQIGVPPGRSAPPGVLGWPLPGYRIVLVDPAIGAPGDTGEICLDLADRPTGLMDGYLDDPARNDRAFAGGYYHTGDLARRDDSGRLIYSGRTDDMFKSFDHRISPLELETVLRQHPAVAHVAVVPVPHPVGQHVPKAYVVPAPGRASTDATAADLFAHVRTMLPREKHVRFIEFVATLPRTPSGKIHRAVLAAMGSGAGFEHPDPR